MTQTKVYNIAEFRAKKRLSAIALAAGASASAAGLAGLLARLTLAPVPAQAYFLRGEPPRVCYERVEQEPLYSA